MGRIAVPAAHATPALRGLPTLPGLPSLQALRLAGRLRGGRVASAAVLAMAALAHAPQGHAAPAVAPAGTTAAAPATASATAATLSPAGGPAAALLASWWRQFDDPVLTELLAPVAPQDPARAQALARQWVAVRVFHAQWSTAEALARLARAEQAALMDLPPEAEGRDARLARVAGQIDQASRHAADRVARRDQAITAVARLSGQTPDQLVARIGAPLATWRLPHLVAEPPTVRITVSARTSGLAQRLTDLHACHAAARQADRAALAARQAAGTPDGQPPQEAVSAAAYQALLLALSEQATAAGELAIAWLDYLAAQPPAQASALPAVVGHRHAVSAGGLGGVERPVGTVDEALGRIALAPQRRAQ